MLNKLPINLYKALIFLALCFAIKIFLDFSGDFDLWLHLFLGKEILSNGIDKLDIYSFTATGLAVTNHEWLSQIIFYLSYSLLNDTGIILLKLIAFGLIIFFSWKTLSLNNSSLLGKAFCFLILILVLRSGISFRIQIISYFLLALLIFLEEKNISLKTKLYILVPLFLLWANLHGAFALGLAILTLYEGLNFLKTKDFKYIFLILSCYLVTLINPYGIGLWSYIFYELSLPVSSEYITEWQRFNFEPREIAFLIAGLIAWLGMLLNFKNFSLKNFILLAAASYLGFSSVRHTPLLAIMALPALRDSFQFLFKEKETQSPSNLLSNIVSLFVAILGLVFIAGSWPQSLKINNQVEPLPVKSIEYLKANKLSGNIILPLHWGGYTLFHTAPDIKVSIDGRWATVYPKEVMQLNHEFSYAAGQYHWKEIIEELEPDYILIEANNPALKEVLAEPDLSLLVDEQQAYLFKITN